MKPLIISISGTASNTGKTTLLCDLISELSQDGGWEAIKLTRGHHRSCGKDPQTCCISGLLGEEPMVFSGRDGNCSAGKDTGRYWDAGAVNVHWVVATNDQVGQGMAAALSLVRSGRVLIEGTSFLKYVTPDYAILVSPSNPGKIKPSARAGLLRGQFNAIYFSEEGPAECLTQQFIDGLKTGNGLILEREPLSKLVFYSKSDLAALVARVRSLTTEQESSGSVLVREQ